MTALAKSAVKAYFETGDRPTQAQFVDLVDSYTDFDATLYALATAAQRGATGVVLIEATASVTTRPAGAVGIQLLSAAATASAQRHLGAGAVGIQLIESTGTASASNALGLGTMSIQNANAVAITGGSLTGANIGGGNIDGVPIGASSRSTGDFQRLRVEDGSAATPSISFVSDTDTGFIRTGTNTIAVITAGATAMSISAAGEITKPLQPAFLAFNSSSDANQTGAGATATVDFDTEVFDQGGDFASDTFTAPVTGRYHFDTSVNLANFGASSVDIEIRIVTSNRTYRRLITGGIPTTNVSRETNLSCLADMDAADTALVRIIVTGMAGDTCTISGDGTVLLTYFDGHLVA